MTDYLSLAIVAMAISVIVSVIKHAAGVSGTKASVITIIVSLVAGGIYAFLKDTVYWQTFLEVLGFANVVYLLLVQHVDTAIQTAVQATPPTIPTPPAV